MKTRVIAAAAFVPLLAIIILFLPSVATAILFAVLGALAAYELLGGTGLVKHNRLIIESMVMAAVVPVWCYLEVELEIENGNAFVLLGVLGFMIVMFGEMMASHVKLRFENIAYCFVAGLLIPYLFSSIVRIHGGQNGTGRYLVAIPFVVAFLSDTGAYFVGKFFGHNKLAPVISPKKTIEGVIGGVISAIVGMLLYTLVMDLAFSFDGHYGYAIIYGLIGSLAGVFGDLCFSVIKRQTGIKDYGNLIPGHGGVLDRFDSMMVVGPLMEALMMLIPVVS